MLWVSLPHATFGLVTQDDRVIDAAPIARWSIGKPVSEVVSYYLSRKAEIKEVGLSENRGISLTFKAGPGYEAPWVVIHADTVDEAGQLLTEVRQKGVFGAVKAAAVEFANGPGGVTEAQAVQTIQNAFPGSQVIQPPQQPQGQPQGQGDPFSSPPCPACGGPTKYKEGTSQQGNAYKAYFCAQAPRGAKGHAIWL